MACYPALVAVETESDYVTPSPRENGSPRQEEVPEKPALYYSAVKKDKQNLRKKVVRHDGEMNHDNNIVSDEGPLSDGSGVLCADYMRSNFFIL